MRRLTFLTVFLAATTHLVFPADIRTNVVWSGDHRVTETLTVHHSGSLTIRPGVKVEIATNACIYVESYIRAEGTSAKPIIFTRVGHQSGSGYWGKIRLDATLAENRFLFCQFWYARGDIDSGEGNDGVISTLAARFLMEDCAGYHFLGDFLNIWTGSVATVRRCSIPFGDNVPTRNVGEGIQAYYSDLEVDACTFGYREGRMDAIDLEGPHSQVWVHDSVFLGSNLDDGCDFDNCHGTVERCWFFNYIGTAPGWAGRCGGVTMNLGSRPTVRNNVFINCRQGIIAKGDCHPNISNCTFVNCFSDIAAYEAGEAPSYQVGHPFVRNCVMWGTTSQTLVLGNDSGGVKKSAVDIDYCDVYSLATLYRGDPRVTYGPHLFRADPKFARLVGPLGFVSRQVSPLGYDLRLRDGSPCIGRGQYGVDLGAFPFVTAVLNWRLY
jgi:hypothetical protein